MDEQPKRKESIIGLVIAVLGLGLLLISYFERMLEEGPKIVPTIMTVLVVFILVIAVFSLRDVLRRR